MGFLVYYDRVADTTSSTGTGPLTLNNTPPAAFQDFAVVGNGNFCCIAIEDLLNNAFEVTVCSCAISGSTVTLTRLATLQSSNNNQPVNLAAGSKNIYLVNPAGNIPSAGSLVLLEQYTANNSATLDFTNSISTLYDEYVIELVNVIPATNNVDLWMRMSTNNGSSYDSSSSYFASGLGANNTGSAALGQSNNAQIGQIAFQNAGNIENSSGLGVCGTIKLFNPDSGNDKMLSYNLFYPAASGGTFVLQNLIGSGAYTNSSPVNAFRFLFSSGNITSGIIRVYGIAKTPPPTTPSNSGLVLLEEHIANNTTGELDFTNWYSTLYDEYEVEMVSLQTASATSLFMHVSTNGGVSYDTASNHYAWSLGVASNNSVLSAGASNGDTGFDLLGSNANTTDASGNYPVSGRLTIYNPAAFKNMAGHMTWGVTSGQNPYAVIMAGRYIPGTAVNALRLIVGSGNFLSGAVRVYGKARQLQTLPNIATNTVVPTIQISGGLVLLEQHTANNSSELDFTNWYSTQYDQYVIEMDNIVLATNNTSFLQQFSSNGGTSYDSGSNYNSMYESAWNNSGGPGGSNSTAFNAWGTIRNTHPFCGTMKVTVPFGATDILAQGEVTWYHDSLNTWIGQSTQWAYSGSAQPNAIRFYPGSGNISSGTIRIYGVSKVVSNPAAPPNGLVLLETHSANGSATLDCTSWFSGQYDEYVVELIDIIPATNNTDLELQVSTNGGSSWDTTSGHYQYQQQYAYSSSTAGAFGSTTDTSCKLCGNVDNGSNHTLSGTLRLYNPGGNNWKIINSRVGYYNNVTGSLLTLRGDAYYAQTTAYNAIRLVMSSGNISSGTIRVYGVPKTIVNPQPPGALVLLEEHTANNSATLNFTNWYSSNYDDYEIRFVNIVPVTNAATFEMLCSTNGGSSYDTGANYDITESYAYPNSGFQGGVTGQTSGIGLGSVNNSAAVPGVSGSLNMIDPGNSARYKVVSGVLTEYNNSTGTLLTYLNATMYRNTSPVNALQFLFSSGNISSGSIRIYGRVK